MISVVSNFYFHCFVLFILGGYLKYLLAPLLCSLQIESLLIFNIRSCITILLPFYDFNMVSNQQYHNLSQ